MVVLSPGGYGVLKGKPTPKPLYVGLQGLSLKPPRSKPYVRIYGDEYRVFPEEVTWVKGERLRQEELNLELLSKLTLLSRSFEDVEGALMNHETYSLSR